MADTITQNLIRENEKILKEQDMLLVRLEMLNNENFFLREVIKNLSLKEK